MIGFTGFGVRLCESFDNEAQMRRTSTGQQALLHVLAVDEQAHAIAGVERELRQSYRCGACVVEL